MLRKKMGKKKRGRILKKCTLFSVIHYLDLVKKYQPQSHFYQSLTLSPNFIILLYNKTSLSDIVRSLW